MITLESMAIGKPILCLNFGGPGKWLLMNLMAFLLILWIIIQQ